MLKCLYWVLMFFMDFCLCFLELCELFEFGVFGDGFFFDDDCDGGDGVGDDDDVVVVKGGDMVGCDICNFCWLCDMLNFEVDY